MSNERFLQKTMPAPSFTTVPTPTLPTPGIPENPGDPLGTPADYWGQLALSGPVENKNVNLVTNSGQLDITSAPGVPNGTWLAVERGVALRGGAANPNENIRLAPASVPTGITNMGVRTVNATLVDTYGGQKIDGYLRVDSFGIGTGIAQPSGPPIPDAVNPGDAVNHLNQLLAFLRLRGDILP